MSFKNIKLQINYIFDEILISFFINNNFYKYLLYNFIDKCLKKSKDLVKILKINRIK